MLTASLRQVAGCPQSLSSWLYIGAASPWHATICCQGLDLVRLVQAGLNDTRAQPSAALYASLMLKDATTRDSKCAHQQVHSPWAPKAFIAGQPEGLRLSALDRP